MSPGFLIRGKEKVLSGHIYARIPKSIFRLKGMSEIYQWFVVLDQDSSHPNNIPHSPPIFPTHTKQEKTY
jgi:hypothetical protein